MLHSSIDATLRNLSTLAIICAIFLAPLHLVYGFVNRDAITVRELAPAIEEFPEARQVRSVGRAELDRERLSRWLVIGLELLVMVPLLLRPTRRVLRWDAQGVAPSALGALRGGEAGMGTPRMGVVVGGAAIALVVIVLVEVASAIVVPVLEDSSEWVGVVAGQTLARSLGLPFLTTALVIGGREAGEPLDLY